MKVRNISDLSGSYGPTSQKGTSEIEAENSRAGVAGGQNATANRQAEAITLADDFGSSDPAEIERRAKRVQELKAQNDAGTLRPANSKDVAKKIIEELVL